MEKLTVNTDGPPMFQRQVSFKDVDHEKHPYREYGAHNECLHPEPGAGSDEMLVEAPQADLGDLEWYARFLPAHSKSR